MTVQTHPDRFEAVLFEGPFVVVRAYDNDAGVSLFLRTPADCDALIAAAVEAKRLLDPPATAASPLTTGPCECRHGGVVHAAIAPYRCLHKGCDCERFSPAAPVIADTAPTGMQSPAPMVRAVTDSEWADGESFSWCECGHSQLSHDEDDDAPAPTGMQSPAPVVRVVDGAITAVAKDPCLCDHTFARHHLGPVRRERCLDTACGCKLYRQAGL